MSYFLVTKTNLSSGHLLVGAAGETEWNGLLSEMALTVKKKTRRLLKGSLPLMLREEISENLSRHLPKLGGV